MTYALYVRIDHRDRWLRLRRAFPTHQAAWRRAIWHMTFHPHHGIHIVEERP